ncbi:MAG: N-acetyl-gamma-glutamyl-phosphate reductase [Actinobacteria bacterium]|nr:N-acetyl-gamma-glutamyl-phosphate reductase [Actinomycetota bacterium]
MRRSGAHGKRGGDVITASIIGATGYTGLVLTDLLSCHPQVRIEALTSVTYKGRSISETFPRMRVEGTYVEYELSRVEGSDVCFVCYPHAEAHPVVAELVASGIRVVDLSADFRLRDMVLYQEWYGFVHAYPELVAEAAYGLPELYRKEIVGARVVANPGCYPTGAILGVAPLAQILDESAVIIDSKSGVSGAGRTATDKTHFCSVHDDFKAYSEVGHRHTCEMGQEISALAGRTVPVSFTPHLLPVDRGILTVAYLKLEKDRAENHGLVVDSEEELLRVYAEHYADEPFVEVVRHAPSLREVQWTNMCRMTVRLDQTAGLVKVITVIDNLVKGASGQAVQNMNLMFGFEESMGLGVRV